MCEKRIGCYKKFRVQKKEPLRLKNTIAHTHKGILLSLTKEENPDTCYMDDP